jgi:protein SCO1/2
MKLALALLIAAAPVAGAAEVPPPLREIGFDQKLGESLPFAAAFADEAGRIVRLGDYFGSRPVVLNFVYHDCPMLCTVSMNGLLSALRVASVVPGREFEMITISFDPRETPALAATKKKAWLARYPRPEAEAGWHFLTGAREDIDRVTGAAGFRYTWDERTKQFAHPAGLVVATAEGKIARYLFGIEYAPKDLRLAVVEAGEGRIGNPVVNAVLLSCFRYDPATGRYSLSILSAVRWLGMATVLGLGGFVVVMRRRERRKTGRTESDADSESDAESESDADADSDSDSGAGGGRRT